MSVWLVLLAVKGLTATRHATHQDGSRAVPRRACRLVANPDITPLLGNFRIAGDPPKCRFLARTALLQTTARTRIRPQNAHRCEQPGQQQGRRFPSLSCEHSLSTCRRLVSSFLTEMVQQIHSLRASGVMSSQAASAFASDASAFRRSAGRLCTTPPEI